MTNKITIEIVRDMFAEHMVKELLVSKNIKVSIKEMQSMITSARKDTDEAVTKLVNKQNKENK